MTPRLPLPAAFCPHQPDASRAERNMVEYSNPPPLTVSISCGPARGVRASLTDGSTADMLLLAVGSVPTEDYRKWSASSIAPAGYDEPAFSRRKQKGCRATHLQGRAQAWASGNAATLWVPPGNGALVDARLLPTPRSTRQTRKQRQYKADCPPSSHRPGHRLASSLRLDHCLSLVPARQGLASPYAVGRESGPILKDAARGASEHTPIFPARSLTKVLAAG